MITRQTKEHVERRSEVTFEDIGVSEDDGLNGLTTVHGRRGAPTCTF